jgi:hypothetical protein
MKICKTYLLCALFSLLAVAQASAQSIVGAWSGSDTETTKEGAAVFVFLANGSFYYIENVAKSEAPGGFPGFERGTYTWNPTTGAITFNTVQDLNGNTGIGGANGRTDLQFIVSGNTGTFIVPGGDGTSSGMRVTGASPIVGAWSYGNAAVADDSGVILFLPNGVYFMAEDGDSTAATGDPSGHDGIEHGTYAWNPATGVLTSSRTPAPYVDTNGEWGLSHVKPTTTFLVSADGLTLTVNEGAGTQPFPLGRVGALSTPPATKPDLNQHGLTGSWYEAATGGQGFEVEVFANPSAGAGSTFVSWFTYDTVAGGAERQRWYTAQGQAVTGQPNAALTIYRNTGGNFNAPPVTAAQVVGTATLSFDTCTSGQLAYTFTDGTGRTGTIPLTRLTQNVTCSTTSSYPTNADFALSGNWYDPATAGQGFTVEVNPNSGALFAAWYTYMPNGTAAGAAGQRWYTAQAAFTPGMRSIPVTIYQTSGGVFDTPTPPGQNTVPVGTGTMAFQSCSAATLSYNFTGGSSIGLAGTIPLSRVGPLPPGCTT